jgi:hypothetical protein
MVGQFFIWFNVPFGYKKDSPSPINCLTVWSTAMVHIAHSIPAGTTIDINVSTHTKNILITSICIGWDTVTDILYDGGISFDRETGVEAEASA